SRVLTDRPCFGPLPVASGGGADERPVASQELQVAVAGPADVELPVVVAVVVVLALREDVPGLCRSAVDPVMVVVGVASGRRNRAAGVAADTVAAAHLELELG